ncbi:MAG: ATP-dependent RecD-like DNA helicase [Firmicutes bacterium]|nr:ATP-dependent RecD-like DNA helicase [Bacillota bacterium]
MNEKDCIRGEVTSVIYKNEENGYTVFIIESEDREIVCTGYTPDIISGETVSLTGAYKVHPSYGKQFDVELYEKMLPETLDGMEKYLGSGIIKGIGKKTAKRIMEKFGEAAFFVIEEKPERLAEIKGITYEKAMKISEIFSSQAKMRSAMVFLQSYGISPAIAMRIYKKYKAATVEVVKANPYALAESGLGIGFKMADRIAFAMGVDENSVHRIKAGILYVLNQEIADGNVCSPEERVIRKISELLSAPEEAVENALLELVINQEIKVEETPDGAFIYLNSYYVAEGYVARRLAEISCDFFPILPEAGRSALSKARDSMDFDLDPVQIQSAEEVCENGVIVITGGPGTGKTTLINTLIKMFENLDMKVLLGAPTGRAAKRMSEASGKNAQTIHRMLGVISLDDNRRMQRFDHDEENPLEADVIIIDEMSMVDLMLMQSLLRAVPEGARLILVGDADQLPSVGAGMVLKDIISSGILKVVKLTKIFRQAEESAIVTNAHKIIHGEYPVLNQKGKDFYLVKRSYMEDVQQVIVDLVKNRLPAYLNRDSFADIQVITPMRKGTLGVEGLNLALQKALNPKSRDKNEISVKGTLFREGDKVMQVKNNYSIEWRVSDDGLIKEYGAGVFNGDCGVIEAIDDEDEIVTVVFDDNKTVEYESSQLEELELSYAVTIHKSQGSEYPIVVIPVLTGPPMLMSRSLLYTAVTRAKNFVVIAGREESIHRMVDNNSQIERFSCLAQRIKNIYALLTAGDENK